MCCECGCGLVGLMRRVGWVGVDIRVGWLGWGSSWPNRYRCQLTNALDGVIQLFCRSRRPAHVTVLVGGVAGPRA